MLILKNTIKKTCFIAYNIWRLKIYHIPLSHKVKVFSVKQGKKVEDWLLRLTEINQYLGLGYSNI